MTRTGGWIVYLTLTAGLSGCASAPVSHDFLDALVNENVVLAQQHLDAGETLAASQLIQAGAALNPSDPGVVSVQQAVAAEDSALVMPSRLGVNRLKRARTKPSLLKRVVWYLPDRLLDLLDIVGLEIHIGPGLFLNYHITRAIQLGGGARAVAGLGWHTKRSFGLRGQAEAGLTAIAAGAQTYNAGQVGTSGVQAGSFHQAGLHRPTDPVYQELRDYWAIGEDITFLILGASWDLHPVELADFIGGLFLRDFLRDDLSSTRGLRFTKQDRRNVSEIIRVLTRHREDVKAYQQAQ